jgi:hypothetical protein
MRPSARITGSGRWLIGGTLIFAAAVLAWSFSEEILGIVMPARTPAVNSAARGAVARSATPTTVVRPTKKTAIVARRPDVSDYAPLLSGDVFRPQVVPARPTGATRARTGSGGATPAPGSARGDAWRGWKFSGVAQLAGVTYGLVEQMEKGRSHFLKAGDRLENAKVLRVQTDELVLIEETGGIARVKRFDAMAELLRSSRTRSASPAPVSAAPAAPTTDTAPAALPAGRGGSEQPFSGFGPGGFGGRRSGRQGQGF